MQRLIALQISIQQTLFVNTQLTVKYVPLNLNKMQEYCRSLPYYFLGNYDYNIISKDVTVQLYIKYILSQFCIAVHQVFFILRL